MKGNRLSVEERRANAEAIGIIIDPEYAFLLDLFSWRLVPSGYIETTHYVGQWRKTVKLHHFIVGTPIGDYEIDHINRNPLDNRLVNLRVVTRSENQLNCAFDEWRNISRRQKGNYVGYEVRVKDQGNTIQLGTYRTFKEAADARDQWYDVQRTSA